MELSNAEWKIMKILWRHDLCSLANIVSYSKELGENWAMNTVHTLLNRLIKKNAVTVDKETSPHQYSALLKEDFCIYTETKSFINKIFNGSSLQLFSTLIHHEKLSEKELEELETIIDQMKQERQNDDTMD